MSRENGKSRRTHFINPYTFVPLSKNGPLLKVEKEPVPTHALFQKNHFTGTISCTLRFKTPAVIPGEQITGSDDKSGEIKAYTYNGRLAIPGSRLRGHLLNLMRAINSSPVTSFDDRSILKRVAGNPKKGFIFSEDGKLYIQPVEDEILVAHPKRKNLKKMLDGTEPATEAICYQEPSKVEKVISGVAFPLTEWSEIEERFKARFDDYKVKSEAREICGSKLKLDFSSIGNEQIKNSLLQEAKDGKHQIIYSERVSEDCQPEIPTYECGKDGFRNLDQGRAGNVHYKHPLIKCKDKNGKLQTKPNYHKKYMVYNNGQSASGRWVKFPSWSGQDGENNLKDINGSRMIHRNSYHVVDLSNKNLFDKTKKKPFEKLTLEDEILEKFNRSAKEISRLLEDRAESKEDKECAKNSKKMSPLEPGDFVYFMTEKASDGSDRVVSVGRHFRYLEMLGRVEEKVSKANLGKGVADCLVKRVGGWGVDDEMKEKNKDLPKSMKGRLWVEMAVGPQKETAKLEEVNLRILSSQPPKSSQFYLENGGYNSPSSQIRGRKFYWHDPDWKTPMWDNEDLEGKYAFENPTPGKNKKQWSQAEVLMPPESENKEESLHDFKFSIRVMNLTDNEFYLLLTSLVGLSDSNNEIAKLNDLSDESWLHKIGHARPFMGSAKIKIDKIKSLGFHQETLEPRTEEKEWQAGLKKWQQEKIAANPEYLPNHLKALKRIMSFKGAFTEEDLQHNQARISYPLFQDKKKSKSYKLTWKVSDDNVQPKTYSWFAENNDTKLPLPTDINKSQALEVFLSAKNGHSISDDKKNNISFSDNNGKSFNTMKIKSEIIRRKRKK